MIVPENRDTLKTKNRKKKSLIRCGFSNVWNVL